MNIKRILLPLALIPLFFPTIVKADNNSYSYSVTIPKNITLASNGSADYEVKVNANINGHMNLIVLPDSSFTLTDGERNLTANVSQDKTLFSYGEDSTTGRINVENASGGTYTGKFNWDLRVETNEETHTFDEGVITRKPSLSQNGIITHHCTSYNCPEIYEEIIPMLEEGAGLFRDLNNDGDCTDEDEFIPWEDLGLNITTDYDSDNYNTLENSPGKIFADNNYSGKLVIPSGISKIGNNAFRNLTSLTEVEIPDSVTEIGYSAFEGTGLTKVSIPDSVKDIDSWAFINCSNLEEAKIYNTDVNIGGYAFCNIKENAIIYVANEYLANKYIDAYYINGTTDVISMNIGNEVINSWQLGDDITGTLYYENGKYYFDVIGTGAMYDFDSQQDFIRVLNNYQNITATISDGITRIGNYSFTGTNTINSISLGKDVKRIGSYAFSSAKIKNYNLANVEVLESFSFNAAYMDNIILPDTLTAIDDRVFEYCSELTSLTIPKNVKRVGVSSINTCGKLTYVDIVPEDISFDSWVFYDSGNGNLKIYVPTEEMKRDMDNRASENFYSQGTEVICKNPDTYAYYDNARFSLWQWDNDIFEKGYDELLTYCTENGITDIYQTFPSDVLRNNKDIVSNYVRDFSNAGIKIFRILGDNRFCYDYNACLNEIAALNEYNANSDYDIKNIILDNEVYTIEDYGDREEYYNEAYVKASRYIYNNCKNMGYDLYITVGATELQDHPALEKIYTDYCDGIAVMNYFKDSVIDNIAPVIAIARNRNIEVSNIGEFSPEGSYFQYASIEEGKEAFRELAEYYKYNKLSFSYHWYNEVRNMTPHTHSYKDVVTAPTCTERGFTTHKCTKCDDSYIDTYTDPLGHDFIDGVCNLCGEIEASPEDTNEEENLLNENVGNTEEVEEETPVEEPIPEDNSSNTPTDSLENNDEEKINDTSEDTE